MANNTGRKITTGILKTIFAAAVAAGAYGTVAGAVRDINVSNQNQCYYDDNCSNVSLGYIDYTYSGGPVDDGTALENPAHAPPGLNNIAGWSPVAIPLADGLIVLPMLGLTLSKRKKNDTKRKWDDATPNRKLFLAVSEHSIQGIREAFNAGAEANVISYDEKMTPLDKIAEELIGYRAYTPTPKAYYGTTYSDGNPTICLSNLAAVWNELVAHKCKLEKYKNNADFKQELTVPNRVYIGGRPDVGIFNAPRV